MLVKGGPVVVIAQLGLAPVYTSHFIITLLATNQMHSVISIVYQNLQYDGHLINLCLCMCAYPMPFRLVDVSLHERSSFVLHSHIIINNGCKCICLQHQYHGVHRNTNPEWGLFTIVFVEYCSCVPYYTTNNVEKCLCHNETTLYEIQLFPLAIVYGGMVICAIKFILQLEWQKEISLWKVTINLSNILKTSYCIAVRMRYPLSFFFKVLIFVMLNISCYIELCCMHNGTWLFCMLYVAYNFAFNYKLFRLGTHEY